LQKKDVKEKQMICQFTKKKNPVVEINKRFWTSYLRVYVVKLTFMLSLILLETIFLTCARHLKPIVKQKMMIMRPCGSAEIFKYLCSE
jgi:hypothetical protein